MLVGDPESDSNCTPRQLTVPEPRLGDFPFHSPYGRKVSCPEWEAPPATTLPGDPVQAGELLDAVWGFWGLVISLVSWVPGLGIIFRARPVAP